MGIIGWPFKLVPSNQSSLSLPSAYYYRGFGAFNSSWPDSNYTLDNEVQWNMRITSLPPIFTTSLAQGLEQQNQINALPASLRAGSYWEWTKTQVLLSMRPIGTSTNYIELIAFRSEGSTSRRCVLHLSQLLTENFKRIKK